MAKASAKTQLQQLLGTYNEVGPLSAKTEICTILKKILSYEARNFADYVTSEAASIFKKANKLELDDSFRAVINTLYFYARGTHKILKRSKKGAKNDDDLLEDITIKAIPDDITLEATKLFEFPIDECRKALQGFKDAIKEKEKVTPIDEIIQKAFKFLATLEEIQTAVNPILAARATKAIAS